MTDYLPESEFGQDEVLAEMKEAANEFREWLANGFESDLKAEALRRLSAKREGQIVNAKERKAFERAYTEGANPAEVNALNERLNALYAKPHLNKAEDAERKQLTAKLQSLVKRYGNSSSKTSKDW